MKNYTVKSSYQNIVTKVFNSETQSINFGDNINAANTINTWVESKTNQKIKNLIDSRSLNSGTRMILVNAIYFKGLWQYKFDPKQTTNGSFYVNETKTINVNYMKLMQTSLLYGYFPDLAAEAIELPYSNSTMSMMIILPYEKNGIAKLEASLNNVDILQLSKNMSQQVMNVEVPKFNAVFDTKLSNQFKEVNIKCIMFLILAKSLDYFSWEWKKCSLQMLSSTSWWTLKEHSMSTKFFTRFT